MDKRGQLETIMIKQLIDNDKKEDFHPFIYDGPGN